MQNFGNCQIIKFAPSEKTDDLLADFADDFFEVVEINYSDDGQEQLIGYMRTNVTEDMMLTAAKERNFCLPEYRIEILEGKDWLKENVVKFAPVETKDFLVYGIFENNINTHGKIGIRVYAATAFGSEHQTTISCLNGISDISGMVNSAPKKILDVGTGSGILAIACAKLWQNAQIVAVDIDDESVNVAKQNAIDNKVEKQITVAYSDGYSSDVVRQNAPYDVILANILARPLIAMAQDMADNLKIGGYAVISGFIDEQVDWVIAAHEKCGLKLCKMYEQDQWRAALLQRV